MLQHTLRHHGVQAGIGDGQSLAHSHHVHIRKGANIQVDDTQTIACASRSQVQDHRLRPQVFDEVRDAVAADRRFVRKVGRVGEFQQPGT